MICHQVKKYRMLLEGTTRTVHLTPQTGSLFQHTSSFCSVSAENLLFLAGGCWGRWSFVSKVGGVAHEL